MNDKQKRSLIIVMTILELTKRTMVNAAGNAISTQAGTITVDRDGETLASQSVRTQLALRGKA